MACTDISSTYDSLVNNFDPPAAERWIDVVIPNLQVGATYFLPVYFWAKEPRRIVVEIFKPGSDSELETRIKSIIDSGAYNDRKTWSSKRYKLTSERHNGTAHLRFGWPQGAPDAPLKVSLGALEQKGNKRQRLIDAGKCPECGKPGTWITMAMVCKEHGAFLGA